MDQDVHIGYEAGVTAHLLDTDGEKIGTGFLDSGAAVSLMGKQGEKTWKKWASPGGPYTDELKISSRQARSDLRSLGTPITVLHMEKLNLWVSLLVVENLDDSNQFILERDFVKNFDVKIDLNNGMIRITNPDRKYLQRPVIKILSEIETH